MPLLIGTLLLGIITASTWASYRGVKESALEVGRERLLNLTQQLASLLQQSAVNVTNKTFTAANDPAIKAFLSFPSTAARPGATAILQQLAAPQDPNSLQIELWDANHSLALAWPDGSSPQPDDLRFEFDQSAAEPFKTSGAIRIVRDVVAYPVVAAVKGGAGTPIGYLVRWRRLSATPEARKQLTDLLGSNATLYFGNLQGEVWTDTVKAVPKPPAGLQSTLQVTHYLRDGNSVMALGRPISGTPWFIVVEFPDHVFLSQASRFFKRMVVTGLVLLAIGIVGAFTLSRSITRPLNLLTESASGISSGDYSGMVHIRRNDELGALGNAFNSMVVSLRGSQRDLEQKIQELKLVQEAASKLAAIVESSRDAIIGRTLDGTITSWNTGAEKLYGYSPEEVVGRSIASLFPPDHPDEVAAILERLRRGESIDHFETERITKEGKRISVSLTISPIRDESGALSGSSTIARDITERKRAEQELEHQSNLTRTITDNAASCLFMMDQSGYPTFMNPAAQQVTGYKLDEIKGKPLHEAVHYRRPDGSPYPMSECPIDNASAELVAVREQEEMFVRKDGSLFPVTYSVAPLERDGKTVGAVLEFRDDTERQRAEEALREQAQILDLAHVLIRDMDGRIIFWNTGAEQMYGWRAEEAIGQVTYDLFRTEFPQSVDAIKARLLTRGHWEGELVHRRRDGQRIVVASHWVLHRDQDGEPKAVLEVNNDITELKHAEEKVRRFSEKLEQRVAVRTAELRATNSELEAFSYSVSHDLRAPLRHLSGYADMLQKKNGTKLDESSKHYLAVILESANRMGNLIDHLLAFSRLGRADMHTTPVKLDQVLELALNDLKEETKGRNILWSIDKLPQVNGDAALLRMVFVNLLSNALKFTRNRPQTEITVGGNENNGEATVFVHDNGAGFDMKYADKLFGVFQRLHRTDEFEGTGIGLANVRRIIVRHGGKTWAESHDGDGATFHFSLPFREEEASV